MSDNPNQKSDFQQAAETVRCLTEQLLRLEQASSLLQPAALADRDWYELLRQKLTPQLGSDAWLVVAVVGGTNIGKSVVFNHLAGCRASASSPLASGTKHPVCLVPGDFSRTHSLQQIFPDFDLQPWSGAERPLGENSRHQLYWRAAPELPPSLLVLDTPDIDSDARVNWVRADAIRRCADVLIAVLTQQKYNDAAVKEFFRKAAAEDKVVIVLFNQCQLPEDEHYWPIWLQTFCDETGVRPETVFIAPNDRRAAEELRLPFYERSWPVPSAESMGVESDSRTDGRRGIAPDNTPRNLTAELAQLRFQQIRMRTLAGSLHELIHPERGVPGYLSELRIASIELAGTAERLSSETMLRIRNWPSPANASVVEHIRSWWQARQEGWARRVNSLYNTIGAGVLWPVRAVRDAFQGAPVPAMEEYRQREWSAILTVIEELYDKLQWMAESGNQLIRPRIDSILQGSSRSALIAELKTRHEAIDFEQELADVVNDEMHLFQQNSPEMFRFYRQLHHVGAAVRPMASIVLFSLGFGPAGEAVAPLVAGAAAQAVVHVVADLTGGTAAAIAGEAAVSGAASRSSGLLQAWFHRLHSAFVARRAQWLTQLIHSEFLGTLPEDLRAATTLTESQPFREVQDSIARLQQILSGPGFRNRAETGAGKNRAEGND